MFLLNAWLRPVWLNNLPFGKHVVNHMMIYFIFNNLKKMSICAGTQLLSDFYCQPATVAYQYIVPHDFAWWRHQMETFSALLAIFAGNSPVPGEFPAQRPVSRSFDVFFDLHPNKRLSKQRWGWWFETLSCPLWCHRNGTLNNTVIDNITWQHAVRLLDCH